MKIMQQKGFTLSELVVVVLIIGILSAIALPQYKSVVARARYTDMRTAVDQLGEAMEAYALEHGHYVNQFSQLKDFSVNGWTVNGNRLEKTKNNGNLIARIDLSNVYTGDSIDDHKANFDPTSKDWAIEGALYDGKGNDDDENITNRYLLFLPHGFNRPGDLQCRSKVENSEKLKQRHPNNHLCDSIGGIACWRDGGNEENVFVIEGFRNNPAGKGRSVCRDWDGTLQDVEENGGVDFFQKYYGGDWRNALQGNVAN